MKKLRLWLARKIGGQHVLPREVFSEIAKQAAVTKVQNETLQLSLEKVTKAYHSAKDAQEVAETALRKLAEGKQVIAPQSVWELVPRARELATEIEKLAGRGTSGEYKRSVVYAKMIKEFPPATTLKSDIGLAIELALRSHDVAA